MTTLPTNGPELCVNIWWFTVGESNYVDQWAVRGYMLSGTDEKKLAVLQELAGLDFVNAVWQKIPDRCVLVTDDGQEIRGIATTDWVRNDRGFFEQVVLKYLMENSPKRNLITTSDATPLIVNVQRTPLQCDTVVRQTSDGRVKALVRGS